MIQQSEANFDFQTTFSYISGKERKLGQIKNFLLVFQNFPVGERLNFGKEQSKQLLVSKLVWRFLLFP